MIPSFSQTLVGAPRGDMSRGEIEVIKTYKENWAPVLELPGFESARTRITGQIQGNRFQGQERDVGDWYDDSPYDTVELDRRMTWTGDAMVRDIAQCRSPEDMHQMLDSYNEMHLGTRDRIGKTIVKGDRSVNRKQFDGMDVLLQPARKLKCNDGHTNGRGNITYQKMNEAIFYCNMADCILTTPTGALYLMSMVQGYGGGDNLLTQFPIENVGITLTAWNHVTGPIPIYVVYEEYTVTSILGPEDPGDGTADCHPFYIMRKAKGPSDMKNGYHYRYQAGTPPLIGDTAYWETYESPGKRRAWVDIGMCTGIYSPTAVVKIVGCDGPNAAQDT